MAFSTFDEFKDASSSEKVTLAILEPAQRLVGWVLDAGSIYTLINFNIKKISSIKDSGVALTEVFTSTLLSGQYFHDRDAKTLFIRTSDDVDPNTKFIVMLFKEFYTDLPSPMSLPNDLASGYKVEFLPLVRPLSQFGVKIDNKDQSGFAIEGAGNIKFYNDQPYWASRFDKFSWENKVTEIFAYNRQLPVTEAKRLYRGRINKKSWTNIDVSFGLKDLMSELKKPIALSNLEDVSGATLPNALKLAKQRRIYGTVFGHVPVSTDQVVDGFTATGTISLTNGSTTLTGSGTAFLTQLSPNDEIIVADFDPVAIESITSDTAAVLSTIWENGDQSAVTYKINPARAKRFKNRAFTVSGHALRKPETTVVKGITPKQFTVADTSDLLAGDEITVAGTRNFIERVSGSTIQAELNFPFIPSPSDAVVKLSISNVRISTVVEEKISVRNLILTRDYTIDSSAGTLTLENTAEFNAAPTLTGIGDIALVSGVRAVTGTNTVFTSQLRSGDFIRVEGNTTFFEVLQVNSDISLDLRTAPGFSLGADQMFFKVPQNYDETSSKLTIDVIGKTKNGATGGAFINTAADIVEDLIKDAGLTSFIDSASFVTASDRAEQRIGFVIPTSLGDTETPTIRKVIGKVSASVFGSLIQNNDFQLQYNIINPRRGESDVTTFDVADIIKFSVSVDITKIIATARVNYKHQENDPFTGEASNIQELSTSDEGTFLTETTNELEKSFFLVDQGDALIMARRLRFLNEIGRAVVKFNTKLQASRLQINDTVQLDHSKLFERIGSSSKRKVGAIEEIKKSSKDTLVSIEDLGNAFSRVSAITENDAVSFATALDSAKVVNGYITDNNGMQANDRTTFGINLIW